jgi:YidC/Oxa1 family membrane protein insertase
MDKKTIMVVVFCMAAFIVWSMVFMPSTPKRQQPPPPPQQPVQQPAQQAPPQTQPAQSQRPAEPPITVDSPELAAAIKSVLGALAPISDEWLDVLVACPAHVDAKPDNGVIKTDVIEVRWTTLGAGITSIRYIARDAEGNYIYKPETQKNEPFTLTSVEKNAAEESFLMSIPEPPEPGFAGMEKGHWEVAETGNNSVTFLWKTGCGSIVKKKITAPPGLYQLDVEIQFQGVLPGNGSEIKYDLSSLGGITRETFDQTVRGVVMKKDGTLKAAMAAELASRQGGGGCLFGCAPKSGTGKKTLDMKHVAWAGVVNKYFCGFMYPTDLSNTDEITDPVMKLIYENDADNFVKGKTNVTVVMRRSAKVAAGAATTHKWLLYIGPKSLAILDKPEYKAAGFDVIVTTDLEAWCCFLGPVIGLLSKFFLWILGVIHIVVPNYGFAIIILTIFIRLALHPISKRQQISMRRYSEKMKKLQPEFERIKKKYKGNAKKMNEEQQALIKEHGISMLPLGGCLPMLLQMPVFVGLYRALDSSIDMRQASFVFWMNDLSRPDAIVMFDPPLPFIGVALNVLPILMMIAMLVQQYLTPVTPSAGMNADQAKQQRWMMYFMMIFFGIIFYNMPAGLNLYWFTSTLIGIFEMRLIQKQMAAAGVTS